MDSLLMRPFLSSQRFFSPSNPQGFCVQLQHSPNQVCSNTQRFSTRMIQSCLKNHPNHINEKPILCRRPSKCTYLNATLANHHPEAESQDLLNIIATALKVFYKFSRPHTVIGTALSIISVSLLAVEKLSDISTLFATGLLKAMVAALFMNIYIVGLNQVFDIDIDKVNKPYLPLASGEYSLKTGIAIIATSAIMSFAVGWTVGSWPLLWALFVSFVLGTVYSIDLPYMRWKRFAVVAAICILAVRAVIVQLAFFLHMQTFVFRRPANFSRPLIFATAFMAFFSVVIALFKDIPDIEGDRIFGIHSFSVRLGQKKVFWICLYLLEMAYTAAMVIGATSSPYNWCRIVTVLGHATLALTLWNRAKTLDLTSKAAITSFYMFIWKLFYAEYLLIPFVR